MKEYLSHTVIISPEQERVSLSSYLFLMFHLFLLLILLSLLLFSLLQVIIHCCLSNMYKKNAIKKNVSSKQSFLATVCFTTDPVDQLCCCNNKEVRSQSPDTVSDATGKPCTLCHIRLTGYSEICQAVNSAVYNLCLL